METESRMVGCQGQGEEKMRNCCLTGSLFQASVATDRTRVNKLDPETLKRRACLCDLGESGGLTLSKGHTTIGWELEARPDCQSKGLSSTQLTLC